MQTGIFFFYQFEIFFKDKKKTDMKSGKTGGLSGKDIFTFNPSVLSGEGTENDEEGGDFEYEREEEDVGVKVFF